MFSNWDVYKSANLSAGRRVLMTLSGGRGLRGRTAPPALHQSERKPVLPPHPRPVPDGPLIYNLKTQLMQHWTEITRASTSGTPRPRVTHGGSSSNKRVTREFCLFVIPHINR